MDSSSEDTKFPITDILPCDLIRYILSFNSLSIAQKCVNKLFKSLMQQNEEVQMRKINKLVDEIQFAEMMNKFHKSYYVIDANREKLTEDEKQQGCKAIFGDISKALRESPNGATFFIHNGQYQIKPSSFERCTCAFIGIGDNVVLNFKDELHLAQGDKYFCNVYFKRDFWEGCSGTTIMYRGNFYFDSCTFICQVIVNQSGGYNDYRIVFKKCEFVGKDLSAAVGLCIVDDVAFLDLIGCKFKNYGGFIHRYEPLTPTMDIPCILFECGSRLVQSHEKSCTYRIIGNTFENNLGRSVFQTWSRTYNINSKMVMNNNVLRGKNGWDKIVFVQNERNISKMKTNEWELLDPNRIYVRAYVRGVDWTKN